MAKAGTTKASRVKYARKKGGWSGVMGSSPQTEKMRQRRKEIREEAKILTQQTYRNPDFPKPIKLTNKAVREWTDQPFKHYVEKNEMILDIGNVIKQSTYLGWKANKSNPELRVFIFETKVEGDKAWIIVKEYERGGDVFLHSISDNESVPMGVRK